MRNLVSHNTNHITKHYYSFTIYPTDSIIFLTKGIFKNTGNSTILAGKINTLKKAANINLNKLADQLNYLNLKRLNIFYIHLAEEYKVHKITRSIVKEKLEIKYRESNYEEFLYFFNKPEINKLPFYNEDSIYIFNTRIPITIKNILFKISNIEINLKKEYSSIDSLNFRSTIYLSGFCDFDLVLATYYFYCLPDNKYRLFKSYRKNYHR